MIAIVDTGGANHASIQNALLRLGHESTVTLDRNQLSQASHLILPGVGHAAHAMERIHRAELVDFLKTQKKPLLGICLGMQILFGSSEEGDVECLGLLPGRVTRMQASDGFRVPHMGWSQLNTECKSTLLNGISSDAYFYFVHSYKIPKSATTVASARAPQVIPAVIEFDQLYATQFHPERSGEAGAALLKNFIQIGSLP